MRKREDKHGPVIATITRIWFTEQDMTICFSVPVWYLWHFVPGSLRRPKNEKNLAMTNCFDLNKVLALLKSLPLVDPERYQLDFDTTYVMMSSTKNLRARISGKVDERPQHCSRSTPTDGQYATEVLL